ncbi:hypothetical protein Tco_0235616, partial [Tanacetum coccineum]
VMSADSTVTYTSVHSKARSWSIPSEDPYEEVARQLLRDSQDLVVRLGRVLLRDSQDPLWPIESITVL